MVGDQITPEEIRRRLGLALAVGACRPLHGQTPPCVTCVRYGLTLGALVASTIKATAIAAIGHRQRPVGSEFQAMGRGLEKLEALAGTTPVVRRG